MTKITMAEWVASIGRATAESPQAKEFNILAEKGDLIIVDPDGVEHRPVKQGDRYWQLQALPTNRSQS